MPVLKLLWDSVHVSVRFNDTIRSQFWKKNGCKGKVKSGEDEALAHIYNKDESKAFNTVNSYNRVNNCHIII